MYSNRVLGAMDPVGRIRVKQEGELLQWDALAQAEQAYPNTFTTYCAFPKLLTIKDACINGLINRIVQLFGKADLN